jgi:hypothetical protein
VRARGPSRGGHDDARARLRVGDDCGSAVAHDLELGAGIDRAGPQAIDVDAHAQRAVGVHAAKIRRDQGVGDERGVVEPGAGPLERLGAERTQVRGGVACGLAHCRSSCATPAAGFR